MLAIDLHTHILPRRWPDWTARTGYPGWISLEDAPGAASCACMVKSEPGGGTTRFRDVAANLWDLSRRLAECDAAGVGAQVLSTVPVMFAYWAKPGDALDLSRLLNDHVAECCRSHPARFAGLGTIPLQDPDLAARELERCVTDLGLAGVQIGTHAGGVNLGEARLRPVFAAAARRGAAVFVHPWDMLAPERMTKYWMPWLIGMPTETCIAIHSVLASGLLEQFPSLRVCFAHGGGSFPGTIGRIAHGHAARPDLCGVENPRPPTDYLASAEDAAGKERTRPARFFVDSLTHDEHALRTLLRLFTAERVALGSDYPFPLGEDRPGAMIRAMPDLDEAARRRLLRGTALEFLGAGGTRLRAT